MSDDKTIPASEASDTAPQAGVPKIGDTVAGKYAVERVLGMGGMGVVLAARHAQLGEPVAIKVLLPKALRDKEAIGRFVREARTQVKIKSEHVVRVLDIGTLDSGVPYILMEHLDGRDLAQVVRADGPMPIAEAIDCVLQACVAVAEAHALGIVHRDLKPSNLFLTTRSDGTPLLKVLDFGISKALEADGDPRAIDLTDTRAVFGSPAYMSPEQVRSAKNVDYRTDIWSLGVILFELLTGKTPFVAETASGVLAAISADAPIPLCSERPDAPAELEAVLTHCLVKDVSQRYATVGELAQALAPHAAPESRLHIDRIQRLTTGSLAGRQPSRKSWPAASQPPAAFAATEKPWTSGPAPRKRGPAVGALLIAAGAALVAITLYAVFVSKPPTPTPTQGTVAAPPPPVTILAPAPAPTPVPTPTPIATPTPDPVPVPSAPVGKSRTPRVGSPTRRPVPSAAPPSVPPIPTGAPPLAPDPTAESH